MSRHIALSLEESKSKKQLSKRGPNNKINTDIMDITKKYFYQEDPITTYPQELKEKIQEVLEPNVTLTCHLIP